MQGRGVVFLSMRNTPGLKDEARYGGVLTRRLVTRFQRCLGINLLLDDAGDGGWPLLI